MFYKNTKAIVRALDVDTGFFSIFTGVLQGDISALNLFIIWLDYVLPSHKQDMQGTAG